MSFSLRHSGVERLSQSIAEGVGAVGAGVFWIFNRWKDKGVIYFRQVNEPHETPEAVWHVEYYDTDEGTMFPVGTAYVVQLPDRPEHAQLSYILVGDKWRQRGIGRELWEACEKKWPALQSTSPMDSEGEGLLRATTDYFDQIDEED